VVDSSFGFHCHAFSMATVAARKVKDHTADAIGALGSLAHSWIDA